MSMLYNLSISTLRNKIRMQNRLRTAIAYSLTCTGILQHALARPLDHTCSGIISANSIMNVIKFIIIAVAYAIIELASQKVYIHISFL